MKTNYRKTARWTLGRPAGGVRPWRVCLALATLLGAGAAVTAGTVDTLGGGPRQGNPNAFGYQDGDTLNVSQFSRPSGLALDSTGNYLFVADRDNHAIRRLNLSGNLTETFLGAAKGINKPVAVAVDGVDNLYVVNQGNGSNGTVQKFDRFKNLLATLATGLVNATAVALDGSANVYVTVQGNQVLRILNGGGASVIGSVSASGAALQGIAVLDSGLVALSDSARHGIYILNPDTGVVTTNAGFQGAGDTFGPREYAQFKQPSLIAKAGGGMLVVADTGNHRVKVVNSENGLVTHLYGIPSSDWVPGWTWPGWYDGEACDNGFGACAEARQPVGLAVAGDGSVYSAETYYHIIRKTTGAGLTGPGTGGGGGGSGTNVVVTPPTISPTFGYFPMGQVITVGSPNPDVYYTIDGTTPTTNSLRVTMSGNSGVILWNNSLRDLSSLRVRAYSGTNASVTISGRSSPTNSIGVPTGLNGPLYAGIGSTIVVPVVANLRTNDRVQSLQFRVEVTPDASHANNISDQFRALSILTNDFVRVVTAAQGATTAVFSATSYTTPVGDGRTNRGLVIAAIGNNANLVFSNYAVVAMLAVPIPASAREGQSYSVNVLEASATSDGMQTPVLLPTMPVATILVTNVAYTVGDSAPGAWYDAGDFGNGNLDNADVNNAFYASLGLRVPHPFTDAYNAMDTYPVDRVGKVGGDGLIRLLDWQLVLQRSLRLNTNNWKRMWQPGGYRTNNVTTLTRYATSRSSSVSVTGGWYRQALVGAVPVGQAVPNTQVDVPIYARLAAGATLQSLQFRVQVAAEGDAPAITDAVQFIAADGVNAPEYQIAMPGEIGCAWQLPMTVGELPKLNLASQSSNVLGYVRFRVPIAARTGDAYTLRFSHADGAPDINTEYSLESRRAQVRVHQAATPPDVASDEWQAAYFGAAGAADDLADGDGDGMPNWQEYLAGTDPLTRASRLAFTQAEHHLTGGQKQVSLRWMTVPGRVYEVCAAASPDAAVWTPRTNITGDGNEAQFTETATDGEARFYRLRIQP